MFCLRRSNPSLAEAHYFASAGNCCRLSGSTDPSDLAGLWPEVALATTIWPVMCVCACVGVLCAVLTQPDQRADRISSTLHFQWTWVDTAGSLREASSRRRAIVAASSADATAHVNQRPSQCWFGRMRAGLFARLAKAHRFVLVRAQARCGCTYASRRSRQQPFGGQPNKLAGP